jgi:hypothetical protein
MGFNKAKMEDTRRHEAVKEAAAHRATDRQMLEDAEQLVTAWPHGCRCCFADHRRRHHSRLLVPTGALPGLPYHGRRQPTDARLAPRRGRGKKPEKCACSHILLWPDAIRG